MGTLWDPLVGMGATTTPPLRFVLTCCLSLVDMRPREAIKSMRTRDAPLALVMPLPSPLVIVLHAASPSIWTGVGYGAPRLLGCTCPALVSGEGNVTTSTMVWLVAAPSEGGSSLGSRASATTIAATSSTAVPRWLPMPSALTGTSQGHQPMPIRVDFACRLTPLVMDLLIARNMGVHEFKGVTCLGRKWEAAVVGLLGRRLASPLSMLPFDGRWTTMPTALPARRAQASSLCSPRPRSEWRQFAPASLHVPLSRRPAWRPPPRTPPRTPLTTALRMVPLTAVS